MKKEAHKVSKGYKGLWMDKYITLNINLKIAEKALLADVIAIHDASEEGCFKSNAAFGVLLGSTDIARRNIASLQRKGYLKESKQIYDSPIHTGRRYLIPNIGFAKNEYKEQKKLRKLELNSEPEKDEIKKAHKGGVQIRIGGCANMHSIEYKENTAKSSLVPKDESESLLIVKENINNKRKKKMNNKPLTEKQIIEIKKDLKTNYIIIDEIMYSFNSIKRMKKETINHLKQRNPNFIKWAINLFEIEMKALAESLHDNIKGEDSYSVKLVQTQATKKQIKEFELQKRRYEIELEQYSDQSPF